MPLTPIYPNILEFARDGKSFVMPAAGGELCSYDLKTGARIRAVHNDKTKWASALAIGPRSGVLAFAMGRIIEIWDMGGQKKLHTFEGAHGASIISLAFSDDEHFLASGSDDTTVVIWDFKGVVK